MESLPRGRIAARVARVDLNAKAAGQGCFRIRPAGVESGVPRTHARAISGTAAARGLGIPSPCRRMDAIPCESQFPRQSEAVPGGVERHTNPAGGYTARAAIAIPANAPDGPASRPTRLSGFQREPRFIHAAAAERCSGRKTPLVACEKRAAISPAPGRQSLHFLVAYRASQGSADSQGLVGCPPYRVAPRAQIRTRGTVFRTGASARVSPSSFPPETASSCSHRCCPL